jgi:uncharacterized membrane protein
MRDVILGLAGEESVGRGRLHFQCTKYEPHRHIDLPLPDPLTIIAMFGACRILMIERTPSLAPDASASLVLLPNRSLTRAGLWVFVAMQGSAAAAFAGLAAWQGNVFAPLFAVLEIGIVAVCLRRVWRASGCGEIVTLTPSRIDVTRTPDGVAVAEFHPYWARLSLQPGRRGKRRLMLGSHGREVEIGAFLRDDERGMLARQLETLLMQTRNAATTQTTNSDA